MTVLFSDGQVGSRQETNGDFGAWTATGVPANTTVIANDTFNPHHGSNDFKMSINTAGHSGESVYCDRSGFGAYTHLNLRVQNFKFSGISTPTAVWFFALDNAIAGLFVRLGIQKSGSTYYWTLYYYASSGIATSVSTVVANADTNYELELELQRDNSGDGTGYLKLYLNGSLAYSVTGINFLSSRNPNLAICGFPYLSYNVDAGTTIYFDCAVVADAYIGPEATITLQTVADTLTLNEGVLRNKLLSITDIVGLQDYETGNKNLILLEHVEINDVMQALKTLVVTETSSLSDTMFTPSRIIAITEEVSLVEVAFVGQGGVKKTKLFLILGEFALQLTGD